MMAGSREKEQPACRRLRWNMMVLLAYASRPLVVLLTYAAERFSSQSPRGDTAGSIVLVNHTWINT